MDVKALALVAKRTLGLSKIVAMKYSPEVMIAAGIVGLVGTAVVASRATLKLSPIVEEYKNTVTIIEEVNINHKDGEYSIEDYKSDHTKNKVNTCVKIAKLYAPSVGIGVVSIGLILFGHGILRERALLLASSLAAAEKAFGKYRQGVINSLGAEADKSLLHTGRLSVSEEEVKKAIERSEAQDEMLAKDEEIATLSSYAAVFDSSNINWRNDTTNNLYFLKTRQNHFNDKLEAQGYVFLNDVYVVLGLPRTPAGQLVGWIWNGDGDNYVDFGVWTNRGNVDPESLEERIYLDFNVDGVVYNMLRESKGINFRNDR